ncbi:outer membrane protein assembly factor BamB family protein [Streptomyces cellulosae]|uniref:PQQ-binding-like beta-propeller repeat protein n=1 Tax=Streptomyces cellulosae TaxID=1968 RepID=A0ABW7Y8W8_STRCE
MRPTRWVGAALLGLVLAGCTGPGNTPSDGSGRTTVSAPGAPSAPRTPVVVSGPWRAWTASLSAQEETCGATAHQIVCGTRSGGLVGRSRADGEVTWAVPATGGAKKNGRLVVDAADERAVTGAGGVLRAANLRTGTAAWTQRLPDGTVPAALGAADGTVYALEAPATTYPAQALGAFRASDGKKLWHRTVDADPYTAIAAFGGRVYTTDGKKVTARDARTGAASATSPRGTECPNLISGGHYLVCTGSPYTTQDSFPPLQRLDPVTLSPLPTAEDTGEKPERGLISSDGVLVLYEASPEDSSAGAWNAYDLVHHRRLWSYANTTEEAGLAGGRFVTFTPGNVAAVRGRVITIDLHAGPQATGAAAPRMSAPYAQTRTGEHPVLVLPGADTGHVVVHALTHRSLRSIPLL